MTDGTVRGVFAGRSEGELMQIRAPDDDRAAGDEPRDNRGVRVGHAPVKHVRSRCRHDAGHIDQIFERDRNAVKRTTVDSSRPLGIDLRCAIPRPSSVDADERVRSGVVTGNRREALVDERGGGRGSSAKRVARCDNGGHAIGHGFIRARPAV